jgi:hypothetical protein
MKINPDYSHLAFSLITSMITVGMVTFVLTEVNLGWSNFMLNWGRNFLIAWVIAFLSVLFISPRVHRFVKRMENR